MSPVSSSSPGADSPLRDRRRSRLLLSACGLLAVGVGLNVHRHFSVPDELEMSIESSPLETEERFVAHLNQPEGPPEADDAAGTGTRHKGEEGKMGRPSHRGRAGLYAMQGPAPAIPQMARTFDPELAERNAGILGMMAQESGHFLASPYGAAFAVGEEDEDVWGGLEEPAELGQKPSRPPEPSFDPEVYRQWAKQVFVDAAQDDTSTFSIDVDTGTYALVRRSLVDESRLPYPGSIRVEEMINYFDYDYPEPAGEVPVSITSEVGPCPWEPEHRLVHVGLQGKHVASDAVPPRNLVFLVDVSGSMSGALPSVVSSLAYLTEQLVERDSISIVVYAGSSGTVLPPTSGADKATILGALERLEEGGSTNGGEGIELAYRLAAENFVEGGINRVVLATDGDFNVGVTSHEALIELIEAKRHSGVYLSALGFGGANYQDTTMEQLADHGNGNYAFIDGLAEARKVLVEQAGATLVTIAKDVKIQVEFDSAAVHSYRLVGYDNRVLADRDFADDNKDAGEIGSGHTVTALYEVVPKAEAVESLMELRLRYKDPDGDRSKQVTVSVRDEGKALAETSDDFRFSAAVVAFAQRLQGLPTKEEPGSLEDLRRLALEARGSDNRCRRAELVQLIERASQLMGHDLQPADVRCTPRPESPRHQAEPLSVADADPSKREGFGWRRFVLEVLYLLPPLLALPLFVVALRRPRRRRAARRRGGSRPAPAPTRP